MKKEQKKAVVEKLKRMRTKRLKVINSTLDEWDHNHRMVQNSYFYHPGSSASTRRYNESRYSFSEELVIGDKRLSYSSSRNDTCKHVYWHDELYIEGPDTEDMSFTFGDVRFLMTAIDEILTKRTKKLSDE